MASTKGYALVTGASGGIGLELARLFAKDGFDLVLVARDQLRLDNLAKELTQKHGVICKVLPSDLSEPMAPQKLFDKISSENLKIEFLVNNAGFGVFGPFKDTKWQKEKEMLQVNIVTLTELTKLFIPSMVKNKSGRVLNVASTAAFQPGPLMAVYYATKSFVLSFSEAIAEELKGTGVTVTALCPGPTLSGFQKLAEMEKSRLVQGVMDGADFVAKLGYEGLMKGKRIVITGFKNKVMAQSVRFIPRAITTKVVMAIQKRV